MARQDRTSKRYPTSLKDLAAAKSEWSRRLFPPPGKNATQELPPVAARVLMRSVSPVPKENVTGVGVGEKISSGRHTGVWAVKFFVRLKFPEAQLEIKHRLPKFIDGLPVDVEETGLFRPFKQDATLNPRTKMRPTQPGCSVGFINPDPKFTVAGTFGALVRDETNSYILSNNHVLADEGRLPPGSPIFQPGLLDGGDPNTDQIAELTKVVALHVKGPNRVDCAVAKLLKPSLANNNILFIGPPQGVADAEIDMTVCKFGRSSGYTVGRISSVDTDVKLPYDVGTLTFASQIIILGLNGASFAAAGDSGSLIVARPSNQAVGLLFAGSSSHTIANHIGDVLQALNVTLA